MREPDDTEFAAMEFADLIRRHGYFPPSPRWSMLPDKKWIANEADRVSEGIAASFHDAQCEKDLMSPKNC